MYEEKGNKETHPPAFSRHMGSGLYAEEEAGKFMLGKYLSDKQIPLRQRRRLGMVVAGITSTASRLTKIGKMQSAGCQLCRIAREARGESLALTVTVRQTAETHSHINSAGYGGVATTVTDAHHSTWRHLYLNDVAFISLWKIV